MDDHATPLARAIGTRLREQRGARGWTLDRLAESAGVSRRMVVNVEQGATNPSVGTLLRLAEALGIGLPELVEPPTTRPLVITRRDEGATLWHGDRGGHGVLVAHAPGPEVVELWSWTLAPGDEHRSEAHPPGTRELLHVHTGELMLTVDREPVTLATGDAASFHGDRPHAYGNTSDAVATFSLTVWEPAERATRRA
ncbi:XRE family transcriptional regulator [Nocardioides panacisoli]|uniref:helix-turn-helix domain-containing protein n=1 Tax=Nocardioides panacisoli TaxID=627624 RepID=UPI001C6309E3|nr:XRE family transcriptional regulator [Nocardioides panacisoli]QYJ05667.1 XRE family transcriptional regulator [Nocardioides panacisoli]